MKVVVTRPIPGDAFERLDGHEIVEHDFSEGGPDEEQLIDIARGARALVTLLSDPVTDRVFAACPALKVVAQFAVGYDNIDLEAARSRGIVVTHTPGVLTDATADMALALLLAAARQIVPADRYVREGRFTRWETDLMLGPDLTGKTMGIVGLGRIGAATARRAVGFGMNVIYYNRSRANLSVEQRLSARRVELDGLLEQSDVVSLHCSLNADSHHLIDAHALGRMKSTAILVNTARGAVVDEGALVQALRDGSIAAAGLDVFEEEPAVHPGLMELDNVVLAPHLGSATYDARHSMARMCAEAVHAVFTGADEIPYRVV
ncbi:MAG: D-glycerate dehydrogenase [Rhodothermales bacterium]